MKTIKSLFIILFVVLISACNSDVTREADKLVRQGKYAEAIEAYSEYLATKPKDIKSLYNRGRAYEELGQLENARKDFIKVLDIDVENINANLSMGKYWYNKNDYNRAINFFDKVVKVDGRVSEAYLLRGRSYHQSGNFENARENYDLAINFDKKSAEAHLFRGALKVAAGQNKSACNDFNRAKALGSDEASSALGKYCK